MKRIEPILDSYNRPIKKYKVCDENDNIWFIGTYKECHKYKIEHNAEVTQTQKLSKP
jgi:hypothetical protein